MKNTLLIITLFMIGIGNVNGQKYPELIKVTGGSFIMGDSRGMGEQDEQPAHEVTLSDFSIGKTEVTVAQYRYYCSSTGVAMPNEPSWGWKDNAPISDVTWHEAIKYCDWLSEKLGKNIILPTEAQWEFAARGGLKKDSKYTAGHVSEESGWYADNSDNRTHVVATKKANELGLYDMNGNVGEWCLDWFSDDYYSKSPSNNPKNTVPSDYKVIRGASWSHSISFYRVSYRDNSESDDKANNVGFRVVSF